MVEKFGDHDSHCYPSALTDPSRGSAVVKNTRCKLAAILFADGVGYFAKDVAVSKSLGLLGRLTLPSDNHRS